MLKGVLIGVACVLLLVVALGAGFAGGWQAREAAIVPSRGKPCECRKCRCMAEGLPGAEEPTNAALGLE